MFGVWKMRWIFCIYVQVCLLDGMLSWATPMQSYVVCSPAKPSVFIRKWAKNIELELELFESILIEKCAEEAERLGQTEKVDVVIEIISKQVRVHVKNQILLLRDLTEADLTTQSAIDFVNEVREKVASVHEPVVVMPEEVSFHESVGMTNSVNDKAFQLTPKTKESMLKIQQRHWFVSTRLGGESFGYHFVPKEIDETIPEIKTKIIPRFAVEGEWWPYPWIGLNAKGSLALSVFRMKVSALPLFESQKIWARHYQGEAGMKMRYHFAGGFALGFSTGYWHQTGIVDLQIVDKKTYTQLPSFHLHALEIGGELYFASSQKAVDIALHVRALPLISYQETPDVPGQESRTFGAHTQFLFRYFFANNWFLLFELKGVGLYGVFRGQGDRITAGDETLQGGTLFSYWLTTSAGIGWSL